MHLMKIFSRLLSPALIASTSGALWADPAVIESVETVRSGATWTFSVTLSHADTGWDDYADGWRVLLDDGTEVGFRELLHPHVNEQPFTRSLAGVQIAEEVDLVFVQARTNKDGWAETRFSVELSRE